MNFFRERKYGTLSQSFMKINSMCKNDVTYRFKSNPDFTTDGTKAYIDKIEVYSVKRT